MLHNFKIYSVCPFESPTSYYFEPEKVLIILNIYFTKSYNLNWLLIHEYMLIRVLIQMVENTGYNRC